MTTFNIGKHWKFIPIFFFLLTVLGFNTYWNPPPGLTQVEAIGPFINNNLPSKGPSGDIATTPIYANIDWESPIVALPIPQSNQMMIVEMDGRFFSLSSNENTSSRTQILDIQSKTYYYNWSPTNFSTKHGGIQNAVFHPQFGMGQGKDYMYVYYIYKDNVSPSSTGFHYNRISRFTWNGNSFNPNSELIMINQYDTKKGHDGSGMAFGNDGFLYISVGDEGSQNAAATNHTQKINDRFRSGVWRIDVDQQGGNISHPINRQPSSANIIESDATQSYTQGYYIPNDNPWVNPNGSTLEEFYAIGLRQPFRMTYDGVTNNFWIGDVGSQQKEEIDLLDQPGLNFEWNYKEGTADGFRPLPNPYIGTARPPIYDYDKDGSRAVIGGYVYRGDDIPQLFGKYIYGDNGTGDIFALNHVTGNSHSGVEQIATTADAGSVFSGISTFGLNHDNEMLVLKLGAGTLGNGKIYRLTENLSSNTQNFPAKLSQTGVFSNLQNLTPAAGVIPYDVNNPLWSAGTDKKRWVAIPNDGNVNTNAERIGYSQNNPWTFPVGSVFVKHFQQPDGKKLETRLWIHGTDGRWFGTTYKWNNAGTDANVLPNGAEEQITIEGETFDYLYPSVTQCQTCHTPASGDVLGFRTHQLNRDILYPTTGLVGNQLETFAQLGFIPNVNTNNVITSYALEDNTKSLELRARSYFDSNCAHCHQPGANRALFDARYVTPLTQQGFVNGEVFDDLDISSAKVIAPQDLERSILYQRINTTDGCCAMPPLAKGRIDKEGVQLVANWINSLGADCADASSLTIGNELNGPTNFIDGHNPAILINEGDAYTNTTASAQEVCLVDFNFKAQRLGNPITPFVAKVNADNDFTILSVGQTRTSAQYNVGNNSFSYTTHSDDVLIIQPGETIVIGFMDAFPTSPDAKIQSVIPAVNAAGEDEAWQSFTSNNTTNPALFPSLTVGKSPGLGTQGPANLNRSYKFNIGVEVSDITVNPPPPDCSSNLTMGKEATQSSTFAHSIDFSANKAIDGNTSGVHTDASMSHTNFENNAWWEIDLGDVYQLTSVKLWNRTNCCAERLSDFHVLVSDTPFSSQALNTTLNQNGVGDFSVSGTAGTQTSINLNRTGRYLRVQLAGNNALTLAEVEIFGCPIILDPKCQAVTLPGRIEAEDFCDQLGIQAQPTGDVGGGENIGYVQAGDWMEYQISVPAAGMYEVNYRVASNISTGGGTIQLQINSNSLGNISIPYTGGWQTYTTVSNTLTLPAGTHTLKVFAQQAGWNLNWIDFTSIDEECQCASGANSLLINGSFEQTSNPAYSSTFDLIQAIGKNNSGVKFLDKHPDTDFPGWFTTGGIFNPDSGNTSTGGTLELGQTGFLNTPAFDGTVFAEMDGNHHDQIVAVTPGQILDWEVTHRGRNGTDMISISAGPVNNTSEIAIVSSPNTQWVTHTGQYTVPAGITQLQFRVSPVGAVDGDLDSSNLLDLVKLCPGNGTNNICTAQSFNPDPNKRYYIDVPQHNLRLAATGQSEDAFTTSTNTTGANVEWKFVAKGNGFWHIQRAEGGSTPRLRTDNSEFADMQATGSSGVYTYYTFCAGAIANTHYLTLPDGSVDHQRLQIAADGIVRFVPTANQGTSVSFRITEVSDITTTSKATLYKHCGYNGDNVTLGIGEYPTMPSVGLLNDDISSLRVPAGLQVTLFKNTNFGGSSITFTADDNCLTNNSFNDMTSSFIIEQLGANTRSSDRALSVTPLFGKKSNLQWYFLQEESKKVKEYVIRYSTSEEEEMLDLEVIPAEAIDGVTKYEYLHHTPVVGVNYYQVIVQFEDGTANYQMTGELSFEEQLGAIQIAPNPTDGNLFINLEKYMDTSVDYFVSTIDGNQLLTGTWNSDHSDVVELNLDKLQNGLYIIYMKPKGYRAVATKFVVSKDY